MTVLQLSTVSIKENSLASKVTGLRRTSSVSTCHVRVSSTWKPQLATLIRPVVRQEQAPTYRSEACLISTAPKLSQPRQATRPLHMIPQPPQASRLLAKIICYHRTRRHFWRPYGKHEDKFRWPHDEREDTSTKPTTNTKSRLVDLTMNTKTELSTTKRTRRH